MSNLAKNTRATVIPCLRYRDAPAAIEWLCENFGFEKQLVVPNDDGTIAHARLSFWKWNDHARVGAQSRNRVWTPD